MRYFEDLKVGEKFSTADYEMTVEEIVTFARQYDPQPFHTDPIAAGQSLFGRLVASGWHTAAVSMRLMVLGEMALDGGGVVGAGIDEVRWPRPVFPGDRLTVRTEIVALEPSPLRPEQGCLKLRCVTMNQAGKIVQDMTANLLVARRPGRGET